MLLPTFIQIASACGALRRIKLDGEYGISYASHVLRMQGRDRTAAALAQLPLSIQHVEFVGDWPWFSWGGNGPQSDPAFHGLDTLCTAIPRHLHTLDVVAHQPSSNILRAVLCEWNARTNGRYTLGHTSETLHLECAWKFLPFDIHAEICELRL